MVVVVDYGMGNLRSVSKALEKLGAKVKVSGAASDVESADKLVLPGVGAFGDAMDELKKRNLVNPLKSFARSGKPFLGICLGLQLLLDESDENPGVQGLGMIRGKNVKFSPEKHSLKVPQMGWNSIKIKEKDCPVLSEIKDGEFFYFVHSFYAKTASDSDVLTETEYGVKFPSMLWKDNIFAAQFHPEKSQEAGLRILENFITIDKNIL